MSLCSKIKLRSIWWIWVVLFTFSNIKFVRSVIHGYEETKNITCDAVTYFKDPMYQCELTLHADQFPEWRKPARLESKESSRLMLNFNYLQLNCTDTMYIYDGPNVSGEPAFRLTCENESGIVRIDYS